MEENRKSFSRLSWFAVTLRALFSRIPIHRNTGDPGTCSSRCEDYTQYCTDPLFPFIPLFSRNTPHFPQSLHLPTTFTNPYTYPPFSPILTLTHHYIKSFDFLTLPYTYPSSLTSLADFHSIVADFPFFLSVTLTSNGEVGRPSVNGSSLESEGWRGERKSLR